MIGPWEPTRRDPMSGSLAITLLAALGAALVLGTIAHRLRMAPMIGYIAAGLVVGPFTPGFVANTEEVQALADIGVALLMFSIGIQFRMAELWQVGRLVLIGAPLQVAITMGLGVGTSVLLGIPFTEALFIGASVSVCSSVVLAKVAGERDLEATLHGRIALSWSIVQDLLTVVLVVVLSAVAAPAEDPFVGALLSSTIALAFVAGVLVVGSRVLPALLGRIAHLGSRELFIVAVAVVAIGTAALAHEVGVSVALGAFVAGLALAESDLAASVLGEIVPLRELFATVFFVFIGLLLQPGVVLAGWPIVLTLLLLITLGKALPITGIVAIGGHRLPMALRVGGLLGQSGEFSFVLATVGLELGVLGSETFSQAMGAVVLSILAAGPLAAGAARLGDWVGSRAAPSEPMPEVSPAAEMRRHTIVAGYGTVGRTVARVLQARGIPWVAVDADYPMVRAALQSGVPIIYGNAGTPSVLDVARIDQASTVVFAMDDSLAIRQGVQHALRRNERLHVVARAHSTQEEIELRRMGAARVITAERELGNELVRHTLWRYGVSEREIDAILRRRS